MVDHKNFNLDQELFDDSDDFQPDNHIFKEQKGLPVVQPPKPGEKQDAAPTGGMILTKEQVEQLRKALGMAAQLLDFQLPLPESLSELEVPAWEKGMKVCSLCSKEYTTTEALKKHLQRHSREYPHRCQTLVGGRVCGKGFQRKSHLTSHLKTHEELSQKYSCTICGKKFSHPGSRATHEKTHGAPRANCQYCNKVYKDERGARTHEADCKKNPTYRGPYKCYVRGCRKEYVLSRDLAKHLRIVHLK